MRLDPERFAAGETTEWTLSLASYPASEWTAVLRASAPVGAFSVTASASGDSHLLSISAATSGTFVPGEYRYSVSVERGTGGGLERHVVASGYLTVAPALDGSAPGDHRTTWRKIRDDLVAAYQEYVATGALRASYSIGDSSRSFTSHVEITDAIALANRQVAKEDAKERLLSGDGGATKIYTRFRL